MVIEVDPNELLEVISLIPAMRPSERSNGVATVLAMVSGLAPGIFAETEMTGKSTRGMGETGNKKKPTMPANATPMVSRVVATGRLIKGAEMLILD
jgi:hypothetical protein